MENQEVDINFKIEQFKIFHELLTSNAPDGYVPWFFPCEKNGKNPDALTILKINPESKGSWHHESAKLNKKQAIDLIKQGHNIGISARKEDKLIVGDIDNPKLMNQLPKTLTATSRKRCGGHFFGWDKDGSAKLNIPTDDGELRSDNQYVLACGSYVPFDLKNEKDKMAFDSLTEDAKTDPYLGYYTIRNQIIPNPIGFKDLPKFFQDKQNENIESNVKIKQNEEHKEFKGEGKYSELFKLKVSDIIGLIPEKQRFGHPLHESDTDSNFNLSKDGTLGHCWRHSVSLNAVQYLCVKAGYSKCEDAGSPHKGVAFSKIKGDKQALEIAYNEAVKLGLIKEWVAPKKDEEVGEIYNKASDYEIDVENIDFGTSKHSLNFDFYTKLFEDTEHLPQYELFDSDLGLDGDNYKPMKKCLNYYQHSLMQDTTKYKINHRTQIDNRAHILIVSGAGSGKTTIKNQNKRVLSDFSGENGMIEVSGVSHPEQLVGKNIQKGKGANKTTVAVPGILAFRGVMNDESQDMLNEINEVYAKSQRLKRLAMDSYGLNKISKKLVTDSPDDLLEYYSPSRICDFAHPQKLTSKFFDTGSFRRYPAFNINIESKISLKNITDFNFDKPMDNKITWKEALNNIYNNQTNVEFNEQTLKIIAHYHKCLLYFLLKHKNQNAFRYAVQTRYSLRDMFCKYVLILAKAKHEAKPTPYTTLSACSDVILFVLKTVETYNDLGNMGSTADVWGGVKDEDAQALEYLYRRGALTKEGSKISIKHFQTILANFYGCKVSQSRGHHYRLKRDGFIDSSQIGKNDSAVWLKFIPKEIELDADGYDPLAFWDEYFKGVSAKNDLLTALNSQFIDDKTFEKSKGDGGVGIVGCALIKKYIRVEVYDNKNKNNIYNIYGATPSPLTPLDNFINTATIKEENKGAKTPILEPTPLNESGELI